MQQGNSQQQSGRPGGLPANFQPPANMPNINFSAPVIRLGTSGPPKSSTPIDGSGRDRDRAAGDSTGGRRTAAPAPAAAAAPSNLEYQRQNIRDAMQQNQAPTADEIVRTIFIGGITEGISSDEDIERILQAAGTLRRWIRATDADEKTCKFGFAEYEDPESLSTAAEVLKDVEVPVKKHPTGPEGGEAEKSKLLVRYAVISFLSFYSKAFKKPRKLR